MVKCDVSIMNRSVSDRVLSHCIVFVVKSVLPCPCSATAV